MLHVTFLTLLRALEVNIDLCHVNHIRYYYYYYYIIAWAKFKELSPILTVRGALLLLLLKTVYFTCQQSGNNA